jgi:hypothetical protein
MKFSLGQPTRYAAAGWPWPWIHDEKQECVARLNEGASVVESSLGNFESRLGRGQAGSLVPHHLYDISRPRT